MSGFDEARRAALVDDLLALVRGRPSDLLPFDLVRERLRLKHLVDRGVQEVPIGKIAGSLGREREFNREFLPREESLRERWEEIKDLAEGPAGFPAVELYKVGDAYFVVDGHHRVSVARAVGAPTVEARIREFLTPVPLGPRESVEEVVLQSGLADFLEATGLVPETPDEYRVTDPHGYERLLEHVRVHGYFRGIETGRDVPWDEEVRSWRETVYRPMVEVIRRSGVMGQFPGRTETDLYLFVMDHLHHLRQRYGGRPFHPEVVVRHFELSVAERRGWPSRLLAWWRKRLLPRHM